MSTNQRDRGSELPTGPSMETGCYCEVIPWREETCAEISTLWHAILTRMPEVPLFSYPEWLTLAARAGAVTPWQVLVVRQDGQPVGLLPLRRRTRWTAEAVTHLCMDYPTLLFDPAAEETLWQSITEWLGKRPGVGLVSLGRWHDLPQLEHFLRIAQSHGLHTFLRQRQLLFWIPLAESWTAYLAGLGKSTRENVRYSENLLRREYPAYTVDFLTEPAESLDVLEDLMGLYRQRWAQQIGGSCFHNARNVTFYRALIAWALANQYVTIPVLRIAGKTVVAATIFRTAPATAYVHMIARDTAALPRRFSPGIVLYAHIMRWAIARGITRLGMGGGSTYYKRLLGGLSYPQWEVFVGRSPLAATVLAKLDPALHALQRLPANLAYYLRQRGQRGAREPED